ncbi:MAG: phosphonate metabolism protein/1,5-bisphosphokinase (PRPP-forming) PhnN [Paracoccaceae bacterium]
MTGGAAGPGRLVAVVGPSGAGKDTLLSAARAARPDLILARRVITRAAEAGGEDYEPATPADFARRREADEFFLWWEAHGLSYGVPARYLDEVKRGRTVLFNGSRHALGPARAALPDLRAILVTAPPGVLAARLAARGREAAGDIERRIGRAAFAMPEGIAFDEIANDGPLDQGVARFLAALQPERG